MQLLLGGAVALIRGAPGPETGPFGIVHPGRRSRASRIGVS
ncbi:hypothetical protein [Hyphomonas sp.]